SRVTGTVHAQRGPLDDPPIVKNHIRWEAGTLNDVSGSQDVAIRRHDDAAALGLTNTQSHGCRPELLDKFLRQTLHLTELVHRSRSFAREYGLQASRFDGRLFLPRRFSNGILSQRGKNRDGQPENQRERRQNLSGGAPQSRMTS